VTDSSGKSKREGHNTARHSDTWIGLEAKEGNMTTESESPSSRGGSSDEAEGNPSSTKPGRNGSDSMAPPRPKKKKSDSTKIVQVANIAPQTTKDQMQTLFGFVGKMDDIRLYPTM